MIRQTRVSAPIRNALRPLVHKWREHFVRKKGLPPDLNQTDISRLVARFTDRPVKKIGYDHLSGWKRLGAFRLYLVDETDTYTVIYKNSIYDKSEIPALQGLPVYPGPPEYLVYRRAGSSLGQYLPEVFLLRCLDASEHYQYLLEDIDCDYVPIQGPDAILTVCARLPALYRDMDDSLSAQDKQQLLGFDGKFSESILAYAEENLGRFAKHMPTDSVKKMLDTWSDLSMVYTHELTGVYEQSTLHPIHGDLNLTNIRQNKHDKQGLKFLDWEWAGIGGWWFDLAALLKTASQGLEQEGLEVFLRASDLPCGKFEKRTYQWAKLQRALFDASFFAKQILDSKEHEDAKDRMKNHASAAVQRAAGALEELKYLA